MSLINLLNNQTYQIMYIKRAFIFYFFLISVIALTSCNTDTKQKGGLIPIDINAAIDNPKELKLSDIARDIELVKLETTDDCYLGQSRVLHVGEKYIVTSDDLSGKDQILVFKRNGEFVHCIDYIGKGPGEFQNCWNFAVDPDETQIVVGDSWSKKLIAYSMEGKFLSEERLDNFKHFVIIDNLKFLDKDNLLIMFRLMPGKDTDFHSIRVYDKNLKQKSKLLYKNISDPKYSNLYMNYLGIFNNTASCWQSYFDTIYYINKKLDLIPKYHIYFSKNKPTINNKEKDNAIRVGSIIESPGYIFIPVWAPNGKTYRLVYDKKNNESFVLNKEYECTASGSEAGIYNDLNGFSPVYPYKYQHQINAMVWPLHFDFRKSSQENIDCLKNASVLFPEKRDELVKLLEESKEEDNPALMIIHLKK